MNIWPAPILSTYQVFTLTLKVTCTFKSVHTPTVTLAVIPKNAQLSDIFTLQGRKFAPGDGRRNVSLTVNCSQEDAILTWSNGGLPFLQEVTVYSSCIDPTNTSVVCYEYLKW